MNRQNKTKILGVETPILLNGMPFCSRMAVIPLRGENLSSEQRKDKNPAYTMSSPYKNSIGLDLLVKLCEDQDSLIQEQATRIDELQDQLGDYEQELYELDLPMEQLRKPGNSETSNESYLENYRRQLP
jgi:hypothetical protein